GEEDEALERAARDHDARGLDAVLLGEPLAQRPVPAAGAVAEDRPAVALERCARAVRELLDSETLGSGNAAGERDHGLRVTAPPAGGALLHPLGHHLRDLGRR